MIELLILEKHRIQIERNIQLAYALSPFRKFDHQSVSEVIQFTKYIQNRRERLVCRNEKEYLLMTTRLSLNIIIAVRLHQIVTVITSMYHRLNRINMMVMSSD